MASVIRKRLQFMGTSHNDLKAFPDQARREAGFNLDFVQRGFDPESWKPMKKVGASDRYVCRNSASRCRRSLSSSIACHM